MNPCPLKCGECPVRDLDTHHCLILDAGRDDGWNCELADLLNIERWVGQWRSALTSACEKAALEADKPLVSVECVANWECAGEDQWLELRPVTEGPKDFHSLLLYAKPYDTIGGFGADRKSFTVEIRAKGGPS